MISVIYGSKGTGKTKAIIDKANDLLETSKGSVIYITDTKDYIYELKHQIRYIMTKDYTIGSIAGFIGFLKGIIANDHDIEYIFIDGVARMANVEIGEMQAIFDTFEINKDINFILTISSDFEQLPDFIKKYVK